MSARVRHAGELAPAPRASFRLPAPGWSGIGAVERAILLGHVRELLSRPTAPYAEDAVLVCVRASAARMGLACRADRWGNLLVGAPGAPAAPGASGAPGAPRACLAFSAHVDHPGLVFVGMRGGGKRGGAPVAELLGGAPLSAAAGARVRFFDRQSGSANATARIVRTLAPERAGDPPLALLTDLAGVPRAGDPGMWDLTPGRIAPGGRLSSRACDDLVGAAAILAVLEILTRAGQRGATFGIFTRAEETGFVGCLGLVQSGALPPGTQVVGLECSPARAAARLGAGPVIRVGDAASVFDPELTRLLEDAAARLARADARFRFQRALMDGGRCESTAYNANGVRAGALCLALANYHNRGPRATIAAERVDWNDLEGLVALMLEAARGFGARRTYPLRQRLATLWRAGRARLARTAVGESR